MNYCKHTFFLVLLVIAGLTGLHFLPPLSVDGVALRRVNLYSDLFPENTTSLSEDTVLFSDNATGPEFFEEQPAAEDTTAEAVVRAPFVPECPDGVVCIEDYADSSGVSMSAFYRRLTEVEAGDGVARVAYFGDSFIEGDILTADLRDLLQSRFGGSGAGFVDIVSLTAGFRQSVRAVSTNFSIHSMTDKGFSRSLMGINERYFMPGDGLSSVTLSGTRYGTHTGRASRSTLYFVTDSSMHVVARVNDGEPHTFSFGGGRTLQSATVEGDIRKVTWSVNRDSMASQSYFYGATMDCDTGVVLDNFSLRGSSGASLASIPRGHLEDFARQRPYDLIVFHFGLNVANAQSAEFRYNGYAQQMRKVIGLFREVFPSAPILIVSVSDRDSRNENGELTTIRGLQTLVKVQQDMAAENGVSFWNLFLAMGGEGSMKELADAQPSMANKDYTHLNFRGGNFLARKLYDALLVGLTNYEKRMEYEKD